MTAGGPRKPRLCNLPIRLTGAAALCLVAWSAVAQTGPDAPAPPAAGASQAAPDAPAGADTTPPGAPQSQGASTPEVDAQQAAEGTEEADCGCPKADPAVDQTVSEASSVIAANVGAADKICGLITPLVTANPCAAPDVIAAAGQYPEIAEKLAQCLSTIQSGLKAQSPQSAETVEKVVACAPPAFQAAYSESLSPTDGGDGSAGTGPGGGGAGPTGAATPGGTVPTGGGGFGPTSTFGRFGRFGSGPVTPDPDDDGGSFGGDPVSPF